MRDNLFASTSIRVGQLLLYSTAAMYLFMVDGYLPGVLNSCLPVLHEYTINLNLAFRLEPEKRKIVDDILNKGSDFAGVF